MTWHLLFYCTVVVVVVVVVVAAAAADVFTQADKSAMQIGR